MFNQAALVTRASRSAATTLMICISNWSDAGLGCAGGGRGQRPAGAPAVQMRRQGRPPLRNGLAGESSASTPRISDPPCILPKCVECNGY